MFRRSVHLALALVATAAATSVATAAQGTPITEITPSSNVTVVPLKNAAMIQKTKYGYRYVSGQQNGHLTISRDHGRLRYADTGTRELRKHPRSCHEQRARTGIVVTCSIPAAFAGSRRMFLEVWPRLGNDYTSGAGLPAKFRMWVLGDRGHDTFRGGAGADFFNGAQDDDVAHGGAGKDWIRTGDGNDSLWGDAGNDLLVSVDGADTIHGGSGNDGVYGGNGNDRLWADGGRDVLQCAGGRDDAHADGDDRTHGCEAVSRS
jgi:Ca2+-binding RTX toxin-like protein